MALVTYSTKPRGGVVHTLHLGEALHAIDEPVEVFALAEPGLGFFRATTVPHTLFPAPRWAPTLEDRVFRAVDALAEGLATLPLGDFDVIHVQDCIAARAATRVRDQGVAIPVVRTVHHVDDFTTPALVDCQHRSVVEPDHVLAVSEFWRAELTALYGVHAEVVYNGADGQRFTAPPAVDPFELRSRAGAVGRFLILTVGGIEPRKGSYELIEALAAVRMKVDPSPVLAVVGGHSFQDHRAYRERALQHAAELGLVIGRDIVLLGTVSDDELTGWYRAADGFVFPSVKEGWGIAVLEAMAAGLPVVASDIPVFREYLHHEVSALLPPAGNAVALADAIHRLVSDAALRGRLGKAGPQVSARFTWEASARRHAAVYRRLAAAGLRTSRQYSCRPGVLPTSPSPS